LQTGDSAGSFSTRHSITRPLPGRTSLHTAWMSPSQAREAP
jgi:hypothetical protein